MPTISCHFKKRRLNTLAQNVGSAWLPVNGALINGHAIVYHVHALNEVLHVDDLVTLSLHQPIGDLRVCDPVCDDRVDLALAGADAVHSLQDSFGVALISVNQVIKVAIFFASLAPDAFSSVNMEGVLWSDRLLLALFWRFELELVKEANKLPLSRLQGKL